MLKPHLSANPTAAQVTLAAAAPPLPAMALVLEPSPATPQGIGPTGYFGLIGRRTPHTLDADVNCLTKQDLRSLTDHLYRVQRHIIGWFILGSCF